jgi:hypothetical protein
MAENAEDTGKKETRRRDPAAVREKAVGLLAGVVGWVGRLIALVLVLHVVLVMGNANPDNPIASFVRGLAEPLALAFKTLFTPEDDKLGLLINYGLAAVFWLVVSSVVVRLIRRLG